MKCDCEQHDQAERQAGGLQQHPAERGREHLDECFDGRVDHRLHPFYRPCDARCSDPGTRRSIGAPVEWGTADGDSATAMMMKKNLDMAGTRSVLDLETPNACALTCDICPADRSLRPPRRS